MDLPYREYPDGTIEIVGTRTFFNPALSDSREARDYAAWRAAGNEPEKVEPKA